MLNSNLPCLVRSVSIIIGGRDFSPEEVVRERDTAKAEEEEEERGESLPLSTMRNPVLPVSDPPLSGENDTSDGKGVDDRLFKGSAMTKRGAYAALSYMACAGTQSNLLSISLSILVLYVLLADIEICMFLLCVVDSQ